MNVSLLGAFACDIGHLSCYLDFLDARSGESSMTSHKIGPQSSGETVARWWHGGGTVVASAGTVVAQAGRPGGMRGAARRRQKLEEFDNQFSTPCSPSGAADY